MRYIALICARGNSKGVPNKNIKILNGKPLIAWSILLAKNNNHISRIVVSTDSEEISKISKKYGAEVPFKRPKSLSGDSSPEWLVWKHALRQIKKEENDEFSLLVLPPTSPLRNQEDIDRCIKEYSRGGADIVITVSEASRSPFFNMVRKDKKGYCSLVIKQKDHISRRQDSPEIFDMTTVAYLVNPSFLESEDNMFKGKMRSVTIPRERALDIDTIFDFNLAELLKSNSSKFEL